MKRLYIILLLIMASSIACGKGGSDSHSIEIKPLKHSKHWVADFWGECSYSFYPDKYSIKDRKNNYLGNFNLSSQFYNIGINADLYNNNSKFLKYNFGVSYSVGNFQDRNFPGVLTSQWIDMEAGLRALFMSIGINCSSLMGTNSKNAYESGLFRYTDCYNNLVPSAYFAFYVEYPRLRIMIKASTGMHKISHDKVFATSTYKNGEQIPIVLSFKLLYKIHSTYRADNHANPDWWL